jgi:hypothetical protein
VNKSNPPFPSPTARVRSPQLRKRVGHVNIRICMLLYASRSCVQCADKPYALAVFYLKSIRKSCAEHMILRYENALPFIAHSADERQNIPH